MIAWYICPYKLDKTRRFMGCPVRYPAISDYKHIIWADGGIYKWTEVLGDRAIVKVRATPMILTMLNGVFKRIPKDRLDDSLSDLPLAVKVAIRNEILDMGYTIEEINDRLPNDLGTYTLRDVLRFMTTRRLRPRYDELTDTVICDGIVQPTVSVETMDKKV